MKTRYFLFLFLFLVTFGACNDPKHVTEPLHRAEALMNEDPDSAWAVLNTLSPDEMGKIVIVLSMPCSIPRHKTRPITMKPTIP